MNVDDGCKATKSYSKSHLNVSASLARFYVFSGE
jgi:hypothetical protein